MKAGEVVGLLLLGYAGIALSLALYISPAPVIPMHLLALAVAVAAGVLFGKANHER